MASPNDDDFPRKYLGWELLFSGDPPDNRSQILKVIGAGLARTETKSLAAALGYLLQGLVLDGGTACLMGPTGESKVN